MHTIMYKNDVLNFQIQCQTNNLKQVYTNYTYRICYKNAKKGKPSKKDLPSRKTIPQYFKASKTCLILQ